jgi:hypothetical protein
MAAETKALGQCVGGWPRISSEIKALRKQAEREGAAFWFLDAGGLQLAGMKAGLLGCSG